MDSVTLAAIAGNAIVAAIATDSWEKVRNSVVALWDKFQAHRAKTIEAVLDETREEILAAQNAANTAARQELAAEWQRRVRSLLAAGSDATAALQDLVDEVLTPALAAGGLQLVGSQDITATASGSARVYQAGRDQVIIRR